MAWYRLLRAGLPEVADRVNATMKCAHTDIERRLLDELELDLVKMESEHAKT